MAAQTLNARRMVLTRDDRPTNGLQGSYAARRCNLWQNTEFAESELVHIAVCSSASDLMPRSRLD